MKFIILERFSYLVRKIVDEIEENLFKKLVSLVKLRWRVIGDSDGILLNNLIVDRKVRISRKYFDVKIGSCFCDKIDWYVVKFFRLDVNIFKLFLLVLKFMDESVFLFFCVLVIWF